MRGHNICFRSGIRKIIFELSSILLLIWSSVAYIGKDEKWAETSHLNQKNFSFFQTSSLIPDKIKYTENTVFDLFSALCAKLFQSGGKFFK